MRPYQTRFAILLFFALCVTACKESARGKISLGGSDALQESNTIDSSEIDNSEINNSEINNDEVATVTNDFSALLGEIEPAFDTFAKRGGFSGTVLVTREGQEVFAKAYGSKSLPLGSANTVDSVYGIGSLTKQFTAVSILMLMEQNKLSLNDKLSKYLPEIKDANQYALKNLLNHTSGAPGFANLDQSDGRLYDHLCSNNSLKQFIEIYSKVGARRRDGETFEYNNYGFILLSRVVEVVSGDLFADFLEKNIFNPLGMTNTTVVAYATANIAQGYYPSPNGQPEKPQELENHVTIGGSGSIFSTVRDLRKWNEGLNSQLIINADSLKLMQIPSGGNIIEATSEPSTKNYGFGIVSRKINNTLVTDHSGSVNGYQSDNLYAPNSKTSFIWLANYLRDDPTTAIETTHKALFGGTGAVDTSPDEASGSPTDQQVKDQAIIHLNDLVQEGSIDPRWRVIAPARVRQQDFGNGMEWVVEFTNDYNKTLYLFMQLNGQFISYNFDGS